MAEEKQKLKEEEK
jgi:hypothetical protein